MGWKFNIPKLNDKVSQAHQNKLEINPFPRIPETKSRLRESLGARFPETKSGVKNEILILGTSGSAFSGNKIRTQILDNYYNL